MKNDATHNCLDTMGRKSGENLGLSYCHGLGGNQVLLPAFFIIGSLSMHDIFALCLPLGLCLHEATADHVGRQLPGRCQRGRARQARQVSRDGRQPGLEL